MDHWTDLDPQKYKGQFITRMSKFIGQSDVKHIMPLLIKNNNISSEGLDRQYHKNSSSSYQTHWDISDNVCLDLLPLFYISCTLVFVSSHVQDLHSLVKIPLVTIINQW
jgi:hypothetical protein